MKKRKKIRKLVLFTITLVLGVSAIVLCTSCKKKEEDSDGLKKVVLNEVAHSIFYAPQYVAIEKGFFKEEGIDIKLVNGAGADNVMTALVSGNADVGFMGSEASIYIYNEGASDYAINFAQLTQRAGNFLVGRTANENFSWNDVKGKKILGGRVAGMPEVILEFVLKKNGIDPAKDVTIVTNIDFGLTAAAFPSSDADYTLEFEPFATALEKEGKGCVVASLGKDSGYVPYTAYCVRKSYLSKNADTVQAFTNAIQKGLEYVNSHSSKDIAEIIKPQFKETDIDTLEKIVDRYKSQDTWKNDTIFEQASYTLLTDILKDAGIIDKVPEYGKIVTTTYSVAASTNVKNKLIEIN